MKSIIFTTILVFTSFLSACSQTTASDSEKQAAAVSEIKFEKVVHDYGAIPVGGDGNYEFVFTNEGEKPLVLSNVRSSCGCTVPKWPKEPIKKGEQASIKVKYNTNKIGTFSKSVTVYSNASNNPVVLRIKGKVVDQDQAAAAN
ncbi:MAG: DUF1573 domain-containing protein [Bacteroidetes bacterium]|jgi:hypothetical protein|nr:DUF1573 domain-containing protein [Bacteroidota bacterium]